MATLSPTAPPTDPIPGPRGHWLTGHVRDFARDRLEFLTENARTHGDLFAMRFLRRKVLVVNHPDLVEEVLVTRNRSFIKHFALRMAKPMLGEGLLTSEGDFWRRQRRLSQPAFHREKVAAHAGVMVDHAERMLATWADGQRRDIQADMTRLTLEIVAACLFGSDVSAESAAAGEAMDEVMRDFTARVMRFVRLPDWVPTPANVRLARARRHLEGLLAGMIARRRASGEDRGDLLSMLLAAQDDGDGTGMTDRQLRDEAMTLFAAGHETTANTLAWIWYLLSLNPDAEAKLHAELDAVLDDRPPTFDDLPRLAYTEHVVNETLRLYPTVWLLGREAIEPTGVGGHPVAPGTTIYMSQWVIHRDPRFWDDPLAFRPDRWADGLAKRIPRYAFFPFGGGPRICIGNGFAMMEAVLLLAAIARKFRPILAPGARVVPVPTMTLRPESGLDVILEARR
ncbi:cytochrome P450 [Tundrisphaera sp. TA3]|uniref:cytochrome P450 n=1 Tax=Tundrisphaera sp. TA3 TaxID=3435775 RepID=UPI003EC065F1